MPEKLLWVDLEMTGLDPAKDRILEVAAIVTDFRQRASVGNWMNAIATIFYEIIGGRRRADGIKHLRANLGIARHVDGIACTVECWLGSPTTTCAKPVVSHRHFIDECLFFAEISWAFRQ